jgi:deoxyribonuclease-4
LRLGAQVATRHPLAAAADRDAEVVQVFLSPPQGFASPKPRADAEAIRASDVGLYVHAPYLVNVATTNNRVRHPSRALLEKTVRAAEELDALGVIVHGGHLPEDDDVAEGYKNWRSTFDRLESRVPILIENTAGGQNAISRHFDCIAALWDALDGVETPFGFCLDTCHTHAAGEDLTTAVDRIVAITGAVDLVHLNDSKDQPGSGRDRHQNLGAGEIDPDLLVEVVRSAGVDVIVETPEDDGSQAADLAWLRARL